MSDVHQNDKGLIEYIRGVWPQSMFQRRFLRALAVTCITTCVWMSERAFVSSNTTQHSINMIDIQRRGLLTLSDRSPDEGSSFQSSPENDNVKSLNDCADCTRYNFDDDAEDVELWVLNSITWTEEKLDELKPIFEAEIQLDGETKKLFLQWNSKVVSTAAHRHSSSHNFGAVAVVQTSNREWILLPEGGNEYAEEQQIFWTLYMRELLDDHDTVLRSISGDVSQIPLSLPQDVSWIGMCITLKRVVCADGIEAPDPPMDPEATVPKDPLKALSHIQRARQERVERELWEDAHVRAESSLEFDPASPAMALSEHFPIVNLIDDVDRFEQSFNFAASSTNTLPQEKSLDELKLEVERARTLRLEREAKDANKRYEKRKREVKQRRIQRELDFPDVRGVWGDYPLRYANPQVPREQQSSSVDDAVHLSAITWNLENLDKFKPIFEAEIQLDGETKTLFLQWESESIMYAVVKTLAGKWIRLPGHQAGMLKEYSKEIGIFNILHFQDKLKFDHWAQRAIGGIVHEFPIRLHETVSWDKGSVTLQRVEYWNGEDAPYD